MIVGVPVGPAESEQSVATPVWAYVLIAAVGLVAVWLARLGIREQRRYEAELARAAARDAVLSDRLTIAGDLHDIVSHGLGAITLRARAGARVAADRPEEASAALADIAALSASATADLRGLLSVLHAPDDPASPAPAPTTPIAGLGDVPALLERARSEGVTVTASGLETRAASGGAELAAYHVVREALANVARHAGPTSAAVTITRDAGSLQVTVDDDGPATGWSADPGAGHGLALLAARVSAAGGTLAHGSHGGGYRVRATIPDLGEAMPQ